MLNKRMIEHIGDGIRKEFRRLGAAVFGGDRVLSADMDELSSNIEAFIDLSNRTGIGTSEAAVYENEFVGLCKEYSRSLNMNEGSRHGFYNPFDDMSIENKIIVAKSADDESEENDGVQIKKISIYTSNVNDDVVNGEVGVFANKSFFTGNVIERCRVLVVDERDLHAKVVRDNSFTIDPERGIYGVPLGHGLDYRKSSECGLVPNVKYDYDGGDYITIRAIKKISKGDELVLYSTDADFENAVTPDQFRYKQGPEPYFEIKDFKII